MDGRRTMIWGGGVALLALLSLGGALTVSGGVVGLATGGSGGCNAEPQTVPDQVPDSIGVAEPVGGPVVVDGPKAADPDAWLVKDKVLIKITEDAVKALEDDGEGGWQLDKERRVEMSEAVKLGVNPTFTFHERDSDLIQHYLDEVPKKEATRVLHGELLPAVERIMTVEVPEGGDIGDLIDRFDGLPWVEWAEYGSRMTIASTDDLSGYQWNVDTLQTTAAHKIATGAGVKVAVIDTGVQAYEDGFRNFRADLCMDFVDDDFVCEDPNGHGTHLAGVIAQRPDNGGVLGLAPDVTLIPVRVANEDGFAFAHEVANGIVYSADQGAKVIAVGVGGYAPSRALEDAVEYAERVGAVVVAPVGNDGFREAMVPARYNTVLGVGAVDMSATVVKYSNSGPDVDLYAPGGDISVDSDGDGLGDGILAEGTLNGRPLFVLRDGTSVATAHVAATAALVIELGPDRLPNVIREIIEDAADPANNLDGSAIPNGMINPLSALERLRDLPVGELEAGADCQKHVQCASGVCEGQGCGADAPGQCAPTQRSCTLDLRPYCGCDEATFFASGTCPMGRYEAKGVCE